jgi:spore coat protein U-like protein
MAQGGSMSFAPRQMIGPGLTSLDYNIYLDATHRTVWGTGEGSTQYYYDANPPDKTPVIVTAFGRIFGRQDVQAGQYADSVPVRILF